MEPDKSKDLINLMIEEIQNKGNIDLVYEIFSEDFVNHTPPPQMANDRNGMRQLFSMVYTAFPDGRITIDDQISDGKKVWTRKSFRGIHTGNFGSIQPSGKLITYEVIDILSIEGGKITEHWSVLDRYNLLRQLGVIP
jgi:predicted ester cyclase